MKKILMLMAGLTAFTTANAQYIRIGPEFGLNVSNIRLHDDSRNGRTEITDADPKAGIKIGGVLDIGCSRYFSIQRAYFTQ